MEKASEIKEVTQVQDTPMVLIETHGGDFHIGLGKYKIGRPMTKEDAEAAVKSPKWEHIFAVIEAIWIAADEMRELTLKNKQ